MTESDLQKVYSFHIYPRVSRITSYKGFVNIDSFSMGGSHWTCFHIKDNKSLYFDSSGRRPDKFLLKQLPKLITFHTYKFQDLNSFLCGVYWLYFFYLIERMDYYDDVSKIFLGYTKCR